MAKVTEDHRLIDSKVETMSAKGDNCDGVDNEEDFFEYKIKNGLVSSKNVGHNIFYCPSHAKGNLAHEDVKYGKVSTVDERGVFVKFISDSGQKCPTKNLYW